MGADRRSSRALIAVRNDTGWGGVLLPEYLPSHPVDDRMSGRTSALAASGRRPLRSCDLFVTNHGVQPPIAVRSGVASQLSAHPGHVDPVGHHVLADAELRREIVCGYAAPKMAQ